MRQRKGNPDSPRHTALVRQRQHGKESDNALYVPPQGDAWNAFPRMSGLDGRIIHRTGHDRISGRLLRRKWRPMAAVSVNTLKLEDCGSPQKVPTIFRNMSGGWFRLSTRRA